MIDVFVRVHSETLFRHYLAWAVIERLKMFPQANVVAIQSEENEWRHDPVHVVILLADFARQSRQTADRLARSPIYVLLDDDHLPIGKTWLEDGVAELEKRPDFVSLSSWSVNGEVPDGAGLGVPIFEAHSTGTPCFVRKGTFVDLPDAPAREYDLVLSEHLKRRGKIGFLRRVRHNHLGYGYSQVIPEHWGA